MGFLNHQQYHWMSLGYFGSISNDVVDGQNRLDQPVMIAIDIPTYINLVSTSSVKLAFYVKVDTGPYDRWTIMDLMKTSLQKMPRITQAHFNLQLAKATSH